MILQYAWFFYNINDDEMEMKYMSYRARELASALPWIGLFLYIQC